MKNKEVLNLFAGLGGNRKKWDGVNVTSVEKNEKVAAIYQKLHPNDKVIIGDAMAYLKNNFEKFDFIWASPSCQTHSRMMKATRHKVADFPNMNLYQLVIFLGNFFNGNWVVENVVPYYKPLIEPTVRIGRHLFWSTKELFGIEDVKRPSGFINKSNLAGKKEMMDWLGIHFDEKIYIRGNHCPVQVLRNCVHPDLGKQIFEKVCINQTAD